MLSLSEKDKASLLAIADAARKIFAFIKGINNSNDFYEDEKTFDAVLMNFIVIGEAASKLSPAARKAIDEVPWAKVKDFRNFIAHDYFGVDSEEVWQIIHSDLATLLQHIEKSLS